MKSLILLGRVSYYLVALMMICVISQHPFLEAEADDVEVDALLAFKGTVTNPSDVFLTWDWENSENHCTWDYITCNNINKITRFNLVGLNISGRLVPDLANLTELEYLILNRNQLHGSIPPELANFTHLRQLDLSDNQFSGCLSSRFSDMINTYHTQMNTTNNPDLCSEPSCVCS